MLGALAWQATVIKKFLLSSGGDRTGVIYSQPRVLPPVVCPRFLVSCLSALLLRLPGTCSTSEPNMELQGHRQGITDNLQLPIYIILDQCVQRIINSSAQL